jgi:photosystem II stability/assembly factor-like uncharacterized protein
MRSCNWLNFLATFYMRANMLTCFYNKLGLLIPAFFILILIFMKVVFGSIVTDGSGKLGGQVITKNHYGKFQKTKVTPANPKTSRQLAVRANFKAVQTAWETLSETNRLLWNNCVSDYPQKDRFGDIHILSGYGLFMKCNVSRLNISQLVLESPPVKFSFPNWSVVGVSAFAITGKVWLFMSPTIPAGNRLELFATSSVSPGINYMHWHFKQIGFIMPGQSYPVDISSMYSAIYPTGLTTLKKVFFKARMINDASGFISHEVKFSCIVQDGLSNNLALTWAQTYSGTIVGAFYGIAKVSESVIIGVSGAPAGIFRATDGGNSFTRYYTGVASSNAWSVCCSKTGTLLVGGSNNVSLLRSIDAGLSWSSVTNPEGTLAFNNVCVDENGVFYAFATASRKVYVSTDDGLTFSLRYTFTSATSLYGTAYMGNGIFIVSLYNGSAIWRSDDYGISWKLVLTPPSGLYFHTIANYGKGVYIAGQTGTGNIYRSIDFGMTWSLLRTFAGVVNIGHVSNGLNGTGIVATYNADRVWRTTDFGNTWSDIGIPTYGRSYRSSQWLGTGRLLAGSFSNGVIVSSNP